MPTPEGRASKDKDTKIAPGVFAGLELNPRAMLVNKTTFFTSTCFGEGANPLQELDHIDTGDWPASTRNKCVFGYAVNPADRQPTRRYKVLGGPDGQPRFYLIPPEAFAEDPQSIKQLSQLKLIVSSEQGCASLGSIGVTADGLNYQCYACPFLRPGGVCPTIDGSRSIVLPVNKNNMLDSKETGGVYGFLGFPLVIFRKDFSLYFTGKDGYAPPRIYFENAVDTLLPNVNAKTTAEMTDQEINEIASQFDRLLSGTDPKSQLASIEQEAQSTTSTQAVVKPRQEAVFTFAAAPGTVLSSIFWKIRPLNNINNRQFMETNPCLDINDEEYCFTGVEDFSHCAFFQPCTTGYSSLNPIASEGFIATRYFPAGSAPVISNGRVTVRVQAPDIGTTLEIEVKVRVRNVDATLTSQ